MINGLIMIAAGIFAILASSGKIQLSKDPDKNSEYLARYGTLIRVLGVVLIVIGAITFIAT